MKEYVWEALYCGCIYESADLTLSVHKTKNGALEAIKKSKEHVKKEHDRIYKNSKPSLIPCRWNWAKQWRVVKTELLK